MKEVRIARWQLYVLMPAFMLFAACGGNSGSERPPAEAGSGSVANSPVSASESPVSGTLGVKSSMGTATVYLLTDLRSGQLTDLRVEISDAHESIRHLVVAESVIQVVRVVRTSDLVHVTTSEDVATVYRCRIDRMACVRVPFERAASGVTFPARTDGFFALGR